MENTHRPIALTIAGFDPSAGAGTLADIKTMENIGIYGISVLTAYTLQTENIFQSIHWRKNETIINEINFLLNHYSVSFAKIGIVKDLEMLENTVNILYQNNIKIIWDPIIKSSTNKKIFNKKNLYKLHQIINKIYCITPNAEESIILANEKDIIKAGKKLAEYSNVIIKGGHNPNKKGTDYLFLRQEKNFWEIPPQTNFDINPKHGSGCVFSSALTSFLSLQHPLPKATTLAKQYTEYFLHSNTSLLGYHSSIKINHTQK